MGGIFHISRVTLNVTKLHRLDEVQTYYYATFARVHFSIVSILTLNNSTTLLKSYLVTLLIPILHSSPLLPGKSLAEDATGIAAVGTVATAPIAGSGVAAAVTAAIIAAFPPGIWMNCGEMGDGALPGICMN